ncbi:C48 family peptidase [Wolbachia endosymbiont (group A) of Eupithecia tripunctaria]|uniref:C48 family peptidase n=1 Tax=Wolbachia endosymbiont (group A) of Eupithecia tripunctaria TaxID=2954015 RepID=UPI0022316B8B|nr:C48 family peptidase [Wolbachia endosymbiont (group A) of Eupithecia tripunctaria]
MLGITKNNQKESTDFAGEEFVIYATCVCLAATFAAGCLGAVIGSPLLTFPLAMLISHPVIWIIMGVVLTVAYKMVVEPLFYLAKNYINGKRASKGEKSEEKDTELQDLQGKTPEKQARPKTPDRNSGIFDCKENKDSFVYKTNKKEDYKFWLSNFDIAEIAKSYYGWMPYHKKGHREFSKGVFFSCLDNLTSFLGNRLQEYKDKVKGDNNLVLSSILNLNNNHWVTLVISHDEKSKKFRAYYCDSFGEPLPEEVSSALQKTLGIDNSSIRNSKAKQQDDKYNCGIFALENAKKITDMLKAGKSFDEIDDQLKYELSSEQLIEKRKEFAKALKKDEQSRAGTPSPVLGSPGNISRKDSGVSLDSVESKQTKIVQYNTTGDGNCFFHAVFGDNSSGQYKTEKAQDMRMEWHKFLSQFNSLNDPRMPELLKGQMQKVFGAFLENPNHLIGMSDSIKDLVQHTNRRVEKIKKKTNKLIKKLCCLTTLKENEVIGDLRSISASNLNISERKYDRNYNSDTAANSFLNGKSIYRSYLEAISSQSYHVFIEEISILASLANIEIDVYYKNNGNDVNTLFLPNAGMINEGYQQNNELWGNKEQETVYLAPGHYERAEIVEVEPSLMEKVSSAIQSVVTVCVNALGLNT